MSLVSDAEGKKTDSQCKDVLLRAHLGERSDDVVRTQNALVFSPVSP